MLNGTFKFPDEPFGRLKTRHVHGMPICHPGFAEPDFRGVKRDRISSGTADFPQSPRCATPAIPRPGA